MSDSRLLVPALEEQPWPSLGAQVGEWMEANLVHGPGDVLGDSITLTEEEWLALYRLYEVYPHDHERAGRRRFKRGIYSRRKGARKTEFAAWLGIAELDPTSPVRCRDWRKVRGEWTPIGGAVRDPYVPMVSTTEEQTEDLAYGAAREILLHCELGNDYDVGLERITHRSAPGEMKALASAPSAREGARTTFQHFDETHLFVSERLKATHATMLRNVPKRRDADPWSFETTTMYEPGEDSIAEGSHLYALDVAAGRVKDADLYFDHRQASTSWDLSKPRELAKAIREASGDAWAWTDEHSVAGSYRDPQTDKQEFKRYWLNQRVKGSIRWLSPEVLEGLVAPRRKVRAGERVVFGFDGSYSRDSTALVGCTVGSEKPHIWLAAVWERPLHHRGPWRVSRLDVEQMIADVMEGYTVLELAPDPPGWVKEVEEWEEAFGEVVVRFETNQPSRIGPAADLFEQDARDGNFTIDGSEPLMRHLSNCVGKNRRGYIVPTKSDPDSPDKIDAGIAAVIAYSRAHYHSTAAPPRRPLYASV